MTRSTPSVSGTSPIVAVRDVVASVAFYETCLGFERELYNPDHGFALVRRGALMVSFIRASDDAALKATANNVSAQFWMDDVAGYFEDIQGRFERYPELAPTAPIDCDYGVRELHIKDPDGFLMLFTDLKDFTKGAT
jgi:catechol 2,3-dioxygenase-like lactoylglutathione lyase family enzyme